MNFTLFDWTAVIAYLAITLVLGLYFRGRSSKSVDDYFVSGRNVSWWLAGTSMVATTFAADTPLVVTGLVYTQGIAGNWLWWAFLLSGMMTVFLFARLWRRSGLLTDVQFAEMRYSGKPAAFLRGFRTVGRALDGSIPIRAQNVHRHRSRMVCGVRRRGDEFAAPSTSGDARRRRPGRR
jgi:Na+/proline symporter